MTPLSTIEDFLNYGAKQLEDHNAYYGHGTENAEDEAWWLVTGFLKLPINEVHDLTQKLNEQQQKELIELIRKRSEDKIPTAYLLKEAYLDGVKFYVDERVLIPRSPIVELIRTHFIPWLNPKAQVTNILDLCTGSGCLGILAADYFPEAQVDVSDISKDALEIANKNIRTYTLQDRVHIIESDLFQNLKNKKYNIIISNPPYVNAQDLNEMPKEYQYEPQIGLAAGADGLDLVKTILAQADEHLLPGGILVVEVGNSAEALVKQFPKLNFVWVDFQFGGDGVFIISKEDLEDKQ